MILPSDVGELVVADGAAKHFPKRVTLNDENLTLRVVRTIPELEEVSHIWRLWCEDPNADLDLYLASARCRSDFVRPHVMLVYRGGRPDCMLLGRLEHTKLNLKVGYKTMFQCHARRLFVVQGGFLGNQSEENSRFLVREILLCLGRREADIVEVTRVRLDSELRRAAREDAPFFCRGYLSAVHEHRSMKLPGSFKEFMQGISRKNRHEIRRHERKITEDFAGKLSIHCYRREAELEELAQEVDKISKKSYQRALGVGFKNEPETIEALRLAAQRGGLRGCVLYLAEEPCAFFVGNQYKSTFHGNFMGFDPKFGRYSPGLMVLMHSIEECFDPDHQATRLDLGWGDRQYKRAVCNTSWQDGPLFLYAPSLTGLRLNLLVSGTTLVDRLARSMVSKSSFLQRFKKTWQERKLKSRADRSALIAEPDSDD
jgi:Acetyltransferase (GNAT) domain